MSIAKPLVHLFLILFLTPFLPHAKAQEDTTIRLATADWPPYVAQNMPGQGIATIVVRYTLERAGYTLDLSFSEAWQRSITQVLDGEKYDGIFPLYASHERRKECHLSTPIGVSRVGFVQRENNPIEWNKLSDLIGVRIGTVSAYSNEAQFDRLAAEGILDVSAVHTDRLNIRRVAFGRIDLAVIDELLMHHLLATDPKLKQYRLKLSFNERPLASQEMYVCFNKGPRGKILRDAFDKAFLESGGAEQLAQAADKLRQE